MSAIFKTLLVLLAGGVLPSSLTAAEVPTIFAAENTQGTGGANSVIVHNIAYFFHDGTFDLFDLGSPASESVKSIAALEWPNTRIGETLVPEFRRAQPDGLVSYIGHGLEPISIQAEYFFQTHARSQVLDPVKHRYLSYIANVFPSDDAFVANDNPRQYEVFDEQGQFLGPIAIELTGNDVLDAGVRLNDETDIHYLDAPDGWVTHGVPEQGVIRKHPGYNGSVGNPDGEPKRILGAATRARDTEGGATHRVDPVLGDFTHPSFQRLNRFRLTSRLSSYFDGAWYDAALAGEGFLLHVMDAASPKIALTWFTYEADGSGRQKWLTGVGPIDYFDAEMELFETEGGTMVAPTNPQNVRLRRWGTAKVGFAYCDAGGVIITPDDPALPRGMIPIIRLTPPAAGRERDCGAYTLDAPDPTPLPF